MFEDELVEILCFCGQGKRPGKGSGDDLTFQLRAVQRRLSACWGAAGWSECLQGRALSSQAGAAVLWYSNGTSVAFGHARKHSSDPREFL